MNNEVLSKFTNRKRIKAGGMELGAFKRSFRNNYNLYLMLLPVIVFYLLFWLWPLYGIQIAFKNYNFADGFFGSPWVGLKNFQQFFSSFYFGRTIKNTIGINLYGLLIGFPISIILALMFNELRNRRWRQTAQIISYAPSFLSSMIIAGMVLSFLSPIGLINGIIHAFGGPNADFLGNPSYFWHIYVWSNIWQGVGFSTIMYTAAMSSVPSALYEAAEIDGAGKLRKIWNITLPSISTIISILFILSIGQIFTLGFEKILLLQNPLNLDASEVISTYVYKTGLIDGRFSYTAAIDLFNTALNLIILITANTLFKKFRGVSLWG